MSTNYVPESDQSSETKPRRRNNRRGGSNRSSEGSRSSSPRRSGGESRKAPEPKPQSFVEKVASFLGFGPKPPIAPSRPPRTAEELAATGSGGTRSSRSRPERSDRNSNRDSGRDSNRNSGRDSNRDRDSSESRRGTGMRSPEIVEVTAPRLYIGNLSFDATEGDLFELFNGVGAVQNVEIVINRQTDRPKGFAFVQMQSIDDAKKAVTELHDKEYLGRKLVVSGAKASERRDERVREQAAEPETSNESDNSSDSSDSSDDSNQA